MYTVKFHRGLALFAPLHSSKLLSLRGKCLDLQFSTVPAGLQEVALALIKKLRRFFDTNSLPQHGDRYLHAMLQYADHADTDVATALFRTLRGKQSTVAFYEEEWDEFTEPFLGPQQLAEASSAAARILLDDNKACTKQP